MAEPFIGQIAMFGFNYAPYGWAFCDGQLLPISQNTALFSLLGTYYGGDGKATFALPDFRGRAPVAVGQGLGLSEYSVGQEGGTPDMTLISSEMPMHNHPAQSVTDSPANQTSPVGNVWGDEQSGTLAPYSSAPPNTTMNVLAIQSVGSGLAHENMQPYLVCNFCIALQGVFPPRN